jgi:hypothetical protein
MTTRLSSPELAAILDGVIVPDTLKTGELIGRIQDDCDGVKTREQSVRVIMDFTGDTYVAAGTSKLMRFRTFYGGGASLRVRNALLILAEAIRLDNEERPASKLDEKH